MEIQQDVNIAIHVTLIDSALGSAITKKVLGSRDYTPVPQIVIAAALALLPFNKRSPHFRNEVRVFGVTLISSSPTIIACHGNGRREIPVNAGHFDFRGSRQSDPSNKVSITSGAERDIVREQRSSDNIRVPVNCVGAPHDWNCRFVIWQGLD